MKNKRPMASASVRLKSSGTLSFQVCPCYKSCMKTASLHSGPKSMLPLSFLLFILIILSMASCSRNDMVKEYFESHGMNHPVDIAGVSLFSVDYAGIEKDELTAPGAREFVEEGILFIKGDMLRKKPGTLIHGASAIKADKPVLYRGESGKVGLMVRVTAYGQGEPAKDIKARIEWVVDKGFWKLEDYAYYVRNELYMWEFGGWLFFNLKQSG